MAELEIDGLTKAFQAETVLDGISLKIHDKAFTSILGPPGAGKTTLLRIIAGVESLDQGRVSLNGKDITNLAPKDRNIAMVYQTYALYPHMKVYDNVANPLKARKLPEEQIKREVDKVLRFLGIPEMVDRLPRELSGGEQQRVAIARSIVRGAEVYLLDEPLTNLDFKIREGMREELKRMCEELGATILYATPDPLDALAMSEYVAVLNNGKIEQYGVTREVYDNPKDINVASIFSSPPINKINCVAKRADGRLMLETPFIDIDASKYEKITAGSEYIMGVRPHQLSMSKERDEKAISFEAELFLAHVIGSETIGYLRVKGHQLTIHLPYIYRIEFPENTFVTFNMEDVFIFDKSNGKRIE